MHSRPATSEQPVFAGDTPVSTIFQLACQVPPNSKKTILDAADGYHAIALDEDSQHLTTFITKEGWLMYLRLPQGYLATGDTQTTGYDENMNITDYKYYGYSKEKKNC